MRVFKKNYAPTLQITTETKKTNLFYNCYLKLSIYLIIVHGADLNVKMKNEKAVSFDLFSFDDSLISWSSFYKRRKKEGNHWTEIKLQMSYLSDDS